MPARKRRAEQLDLFPVAVHAEMLDPRSAVGTGTRVTALVRVRIGDDRAPHLVFTDRHGTYCAEHGPKCPAVPHAISAAASGGVVDGRPDA